MNTDREQHKGSLGHAKRPRRSGPFGPATDAVEDARHALERGIAPDRVTRWFVAGAIRQRRLAALRRLLAEYGAEAAIDQYLGRPMAAA